MRDQLKGAGVTTVECKKTSKLRTWTKVGVYSIPQIHCP